MKHFVFLIFMIFFVSVIFAMPTISDMINNPSAYDGKFLTVQGQAVGSVMRRGDYAWVNMTDGTQTLGFWMPYSLARQIKYTASYDFKGDLLTVEGTFVAMSLKHDGDMEFDVSKIVKIIPGEKIVHTIDFDRIIFLIVISAIVFVLWILKKKFFTPKI
ncbi:MAG: DNA-binding protein [Athalassotoga sp.]|uniref:DNA-binding protein n=2 Tax=Athalassotoga sp. TaxID=2022597 RepID=UPI003D023AB3